MKNKNAAEYCSFDSEFSNFCDAFEIDSENDHSAVEKLANTVQKEIEIVWGE